MRILHKFKQLQRSPKFDETFKTTCRKFSTEASTVTERCRVFEQSVGTLLRLALQHVEALQIMDLPQLVAHCKEVLTEAVKSERKEPNTSDQDKLQDTVVVQYLASIASHLENIGDEDKVMDELDQQGIIPLFVDQMHKHYNWYKVDTLIAASKFLSHCMGSEAYITEPARFLNAACQKKMRGLERHVCIGVNQYIRLTKARSTTIDGSLRKMGTGTWASCTHPIANPCPVKDR